MWFSIETLLEDCTPVDTEDQDVEYRQGKATTTFATWDCPVLWWKNQITETGTDSISIGVEFLIVTLTKEIETKATEKHHFVKRIESILMKNSREILDNEDFDAKINFNCFWSKTSTKLVGFSIQLLLEEFKPVILENYEI